MEIHEAVKYLVSGKGGTHLPVSKASGDADHRLMGAAWAALHGGYRGNTYEGPDKDAAIAKLKAMYKREGMDTPSEAWNRSLESKPLSLLSEADIVAKFGDNYGSLQYKVQSAIQNNIRDGVDMDCDDDGAQDTNEFCWVRDLFPDYAVYTMNDGETFMCAWHRNADDSIWLGEPFPADQAYITRDEPYPEEEGAEESARFAFSNCEQLRESAYDAVKGELTVRIISPGFNRSRERYYPPDTLKRDYKIFEGAKMFADHATEAQEKAKPEGSVNDWVASVTKVWPESDGTLMGMCAVIDPPFKEKLATLASKNLLSEMGVSIRAIGEATPQTIEGQETRYVESLIASRSVDFVTYAGAGGAVLAIESASLVDDNDVDLMTEAKLRQRRPDLVNLIETRKGIEMSKTLEVQLSEAQTQLTAANMKIATMEKAAKQQTAAAELTKLLTESKLPAVAVDRLKKQFKDAEKTEGMAEAITAEAEYIKTLAPIAKHNGAEDNNTNNEADVAKRKADLVESYKALGLPEAQAKIAAGVK